SDDYSPAAGQELAAVQTQLEALYTFLDGPANADGSSSQVQTLVAVNGDTTTTVSTIARVLKLSMTELTWHTATLELTFAIEGDFA
ncbi:MAG: hypothetical protein KGK08_15160, partial [Acidobacteriota bacterium]|nr:hypothetical protein [Acidobacteriota bacterium]